LSGVDFPAMSPLGPHRCLVCQRGKNHRHTCLAPNPSPSHNDVFLTSMWIWWAHRSMVTILIIFLLLLTAHPNGWKLFHF
jgi:hypothetical protein